MPYAVPLVYQLDSALTPVATPWAEPPLRAGWYLGDPTKVRAVQAEIQADLAVEDADDEEEACLVESFDDERGESVVSALIVSLHDELSGPVLAEVQMSGHFADMGSGGNAAGEEGRQSQAAGVAEPQASCAHAESSLGLRSHG